MISRCRVALCRRQPRPSRLPVEILRSIGHQTCAACDGQQTVEACFGAHPDLAILDVQMPGLDGCASARLIREGLEPLCLIAPLTGISPEEGSLRFCAGVFGVNLTKSPDAFELDDLLTRTSGHR